MTEQELRAMVRDAIARRSSPTTPSPAYAAPFTVHGARQHASHALFVLSSGAEQDGPCIIEPAVSCNHCGYCKSYGH